ncbi:hypothetical protein Smp_164090 [Schistosoma mansoni]|uniref:hypothetical protein n=1 Tax=Schistosoma mansoni TaxID=6183 RepID=UPI0001A624D2|nr:hypothetical protein Smp_164090 [Schistosoma mansoni]|eukprot:XP_018653461.1 hypothetical protein Smp_164090 [Schistosoma mansoni]
MSVNRRRSSGRLFLSGDTRQLTPMRAIIEELEHVTHPGSGGGIAASLISNSIDSNNSMPSNQQQSATTTNITNNLSIDENVGLIIARLSLWERRRHEEELLDSWNEWWIEKNGPKLQEIIYNIPEVNSGTDCISSTRRSRNLSNTSTLPVIDYDVWERRLSSRIDSWYRLFWEKGKGVVEWATRRLGLSKGFFDVCGYKLNPLTNKRFHELAIYQQVVIIYALCESTMRTFENLRLSLDKSADWEASNPVYLGTDFFSKYTYIHLPNSIGIDPATSLRIYRISYVKHQPVELNFEKSLNITINRNLDDTSKTEVLNDFIKFENAVAVDQSTNAKRRRSCTKSKQQIQFYEELNKHNTLIMENGLSIPGSVQRLPNWIHPSLARDVYRRWYRVTEQVNSTPSSIVNSSTILSNDQESEESGKGKKRRNHVKENVPFGDFQDIDNQIISEFIKKDHCLNPSPYASFNGPTRQFLSLQLSRTADQNPNDIRSPSVSHYESDDDVENGDNISRTVATTDEVPQVNDKYVDESFMPTRRSTRLSELSKNRTPVNCSINSNGTSSSLPEDQKHGTSEEVVIEQSDMKCNQTFSDKQLTHSDQLCDKISNEDNCDENITKVEENLITEPSSELFTLIAKDSQELNQLLIILRQILSINEEKLNKKQSIDELDLNSDCDNPIEEEADDDGNINNKESVTNKKRTLAEQNENTKNQQTIRLRNAIGSLKSLIANLEELYKSVLNRENERVDAQRLARLRLRKDVEQWEANEKTTITMVLLNANAEFQLL